MRFTVLFLFFIVRSLSYAQVNEKHVEVFGYIEGKNNDTLFLSSGFLDTKFFEDSLVSSKIATNLFLLKLNISYPHLFKVNYASERNSIVFRGGNFFIDETTDSVLIDSIGCIKINGKSFEEFTSKFIPFINGGDESEYSVATMESLSWNNPQFDEKLFNYTTENRDSYVALWALITRVNEKGHSILFDSIAQSFSAKMKEGKLWRVFYKDFQSIRIKENQRFPSIPLKNYNLESENLNLPKAKYILIDYWFSRCKPCLESFPRLKEIYDKYNSKGFEIISISIDKTQSIDKWRSRITEFDLNWIHYLDENGVEAKSDKIQRSPTTFLLDSDGKVIKGNIHPEELEKFLKENL